MRREHGFEPTPPAHIPNTTRRPSVTTRQSSILPGKEKQGTKVNNILAFLSVVSAPQRNGSANAKQHRYLNYEKSRCPTPRQVRLCLGGKGKAIARICHEGVVELWLESSGLHEEEETRILASRDNAERASRAVSLKSSGSSARLCRPHTHTHTGPQRAQLSIIQVV